MAQSEATILQALAVAEAVSSSIPYPLAHLDNMDSVKLHKTAFLQFLPKVFAVAFAAISFNRTVGLLQTVMTLTEFLDAFPTYAAPPYSASQLIAIANQTEALKHIIITAVEANNPELLADIKKPMLGLIGTTLPAIMAHLRTKCALTKDSDAVALMSDMATAKLCTVSLSAHLYAFTHNVTALNSIEPVGRLTRLRVFLASIGGKTGHYKPAIQAFEAAIPAASRSLEDTAVTNGLMSYLLSYERDNPEVTSSMFCATVASHTTSFDHDESMSALAVTKATDQETIRTLQSEIAKLRDQQPSHPTRSALGASGPDPRDIIVKTDPSPDRPSYCIEHGYGTHSSRTCRKKGTDTRFVTAKRSDFRLVNGLPVRSDGGSVTPTVYHRK